MAESDSGNNSQPSNNAGRRRFLRNSALSAVAAPLGHIVPAQAATGEGGVKAYHRLGRTELKISDISFGSSRLRTGQEYLVEHALERGINYFDTAEGYTGTQSETVIGNALHGVRDKVVIASKMFAGSSTSEAEMMTDLEGSLRRLQTDYIDIYFNHAVNSIDRLKNPEWHTFIDKAKQQGKIRFTGMSGHAGRLIDCLDYALDEDMFDALLVSYNFGQDPAFYERITRSFDMVARHPDLPRVLKKAKAKDVGVVTMKTLMGARLNDMRPFEANGATFSQAAFRWVLSNEDVDALVISMTETALIDEYLGASGANAVASTDIDLLKRYAHMQGATYCRHACNDCEGACPFGVPIADVLRTRMYATDYQDVGFARAEYAMLETNADACLSCSGTPCQGACTHDIAIHELCAPTHRMLA